MNKFSILNETKYFYSGIFQNYLVFYQLRNVLNILVALLRLLPGNLMNVRRKY